MLRDEQLIYASEVITKQLPNDSFYCIKCKERVILKQSKKGRYFFSHLTTCGRQERKATPYESEQHKQAKKLLMRQLSGVTHMIVSEEEYIESIQQTADTFIKIQAERQFIYEYQRSIISAEEVNTRHANYLQVVDQVYWLLDYQLSMNLPLSSTWLRTMLAYSKELGYHLIFLDLEAEVIVIKANLPIIFQKNIYECLELTYKIVDHANNRRPIKIHNKVVQTGKIKKSVHYQREIKAIMANSTYREDIYFLYEAGIILSEQASWIFTDHWQLLFTDSPSWLIFLWVIVILKNLKGAFTLKDFSQAIKDHDRIQLKLFPLMNIDPYEHFSVVLVQLFVDKGLIEKLSSGFFKSSYWEDNSSYDTL